MYSYRLQLVQRSLTADVDDPDQEQAEPNANRSNQSGIIRFCGIVNGEYGIGHHNGGQYNKRDI